MAAARTPLKLLARLVRPGKNGGWIAGSLSWGKLDSLGWGGEYPPPQVRLLQEMYALYRSRGNHYSYYGYAYADDRSVELSAFESQRLWPLLDEAESTGLRLVYGRRLGMVERYRHAELCLDVTHAKPSGPLVITPVIRVEGEQADAVPVAFIGTEGHGVVYADRAGAGAAAADGAGGSAAGDPGRGRVPVPGRVLPAPAAGGHRDLLGRVLHAAGGLGPCAGAVRALRPRA